MTTATERNDPEESLIKTREIASVKQQEHRESHPVGKQHARIDVSSTEGEEVPPQPGAVHMIGSRVMTAEQQEEDAWDLEENDEEDEAEQDEERPPSVNLDSSSQHSNRNNSRVVESGSSDVAVSAAIVKEAFVLPTEIQAEAVDEQQEAKLLEILHAPIVQGESVSPGYARYLLPISLTCTLLSVMGIVGMAVFVFVIRPSEVQPIPTVAPTVSPSVFPTSTFSMPPTLYAAPEVDFAAPTDDSILIAIGETNSSETNPPVLAPNPEMADAFPMPSPFPQGRGTPPPSANTQATSAGKATSPPTGIPEIPKQDTLDTSTSQPSTLALGFISTVIALSAVIAVLAFVAHWQIRKRAQGQVQSKQQTAES